MTEITIGGDEGHTTRARLSVAKWVEVLEWLVQELPLSSKTATTMPGSSLSRT